MTELLILALNLILAVAVYIFKKVIMPYAEANAKSATLETATNVVKIAVAAAEQMYKASKAGQQKKVYVKKYLARMKITLSDEELDALIESAVYELNNTKSEIGEIIKDA